MRAQKLDVRADDPAHDRVAGRLLPDDDAVVAAYLHRVSATRPRRPTRRGHLVSVVGGPLAAPKASAADALLEDRFMAVAAPFSRRHRLSRMAWLEFGVAPVVLDRAGV